eukprot:TRINITY_DN136512_c0_g1_i1.p1 TRINITY_DN136512_c0_g1~~TRINITY_DN136512_c0_g1_i1.p1  ORF type:complete len:117 (-),score=33.27 TRINITY_DN136512_c0_g1_i1:61-390(-)
MSKLSQQLSTRFLAKSQEFAGTCGCQAEKYRYFGNKLACLPARMSNVKGEFKDLTQKIMSGNFTTREAVSGGAYSLLLASCFFVGEILGRGNVVGYGIGDKPGSDHGKH